MSTQESMTDEPQAAQVQQILAFRLADESHGVDILRVKEIRGWSPATLAPESPRHVLGVLNLRGSIVPILDLRALFGLERIEPGPLTVIIVLSVHTAAGIREYGLVVDSVSEVMQVEPAHLKDPPQLSSHAGTGFLKNLVEHQDELVKLLEVDRLMDS